MLPDECVAFAPRLWTAFFREPVKVRLWPVKFPGGPVRAVAPLVDALLVWAGSADALTTKAHKGAQRSKMHEQKKPHVFKVPKKLALRVIPRAPRCAFVVKALQESGNRQ